VQHRVHVAEALMRHGQFAQAMALRESSVLNLRLY
jgi:hypothetical protein